jgi:probable phosphoglycerate mutase
MLVRHGESAAFVEDQPFALVDGHGDPPLRDPDGFEQAQRIGERLAGEDIAAIYVTPLQRTAQTAAPLAQRLGLEPRVEPALREVHLGEWENGGLRKHTRDGHPLALQVLAEQRWDVIPGAEPTDAFDHRVRDGIGRIAAAHPGQTAAVFVHGGVIGRALASAVGARRGLAFAGADNGSISEIVVVAGGGPWLVRRFNDTAHLVS